MLDISILVVIGPGSDRDACRIVSFDGNYSTVVVLGLLSFDFILYRVVLYLDFTIVIIGSISSIDLTIFLSELPPDFAILVKDLYCPLAVAFDPLACLLYLTCRIILCDLAMALPVLVTKPRAQLPMSIILKSDAGLFPPSPRPLPP